MTEIKGRPGRKPKETVNSLEQEIKEAQRRLEILRRQEADRARRELDHARIVVGIAVMEAIARGSWPGESLPELEARLLDCVSRESDQKAVRRAFGKGRRMAEERKEKLATSEGKVPVAAPRNAVSRSVAASHGA